MPGRPLFLIAALRRTGSTMLSVALTDLPRSFVFREPRMLRGRLAVKRADVERFAEHGVDLAPLAEAPRPSTPADAARRFVDELLPRVQGAVEHVGFKEIRYGEGWREVLDNLPETRIVALGRDPRDIYVALYRASQVGELSRLPKPLTPEAVAEDMRAEWRLMRELIAERDPMLVRYEDLCTDPAVLDQVKAHVGSALTSAPDLGSFRPRQAVVHGDRITSRRVGRWRQETDAGLVAQARRLAALVDDYREFWGYPAN